MPEMMERIDLSKFTHSAESNIQGDFLLTIKSFDLRSIRARYLASREQSKKNIVGSVERRKVGLGGLAVLRVRDGKLLETKVLAKLKEPRALASDGEKVAIGAENSIFVIDGQRQYEVQHPWFSYIHTVSFHPSNPDLILIASSGLDCIFEMNYKTSSINWEWFSWENGIDDSFDPELGKWIKLTREPEKAKEYSDKNIDHLLISKGREDSLATAKRAAFINSVAYDRIEGKVLATLFHKGKVIRIDQNSGLWEDVITDMKSPHGGRCFGEMYMATNTAGGELVLKNKQVEKRYFFHALEGKDEAMKEVEWLQNSIPFESGFITIDSNRNRLFYFSPDDQNYQYWDLDLDWAVQDVSLYEGSEELLSKMIQLDNPTD